MKYDTLKDLDKAIERRIGRIVKHYKTDWTKYDRPKYNRCKESKNPRERKLVLIARECGTYLFTRKECEDNENAKIYLDYYRGDANYYDIDLDNLTIKLERVW